MRKAILGITTGLLCFAAQASLVTDNFNRANAGLNTNAATSIGGAYELSQTTGDKKAQAGITNNTAFFGQTTAGTVNAGNIVLRRADISLQNSLAGQSFTVSADITTHNAASASLLYGLAFNYQTNNATYYAARLNTGGGANVLQFVQYNGTNVTTVKTITNSVALAISSIYNLQVTSTNTGSFSYILTGIGLDGGSLAGTVTASLGLSDGYAGLYTSAANNNPRFDNLSITSIPEPATIGMLGVGALVTLLFRRMRK